ncbi:MAG: thioester domain-containing protein, partial [Hominenteromicrobium sp.]
MKALRKPLSLFMAMLMCLGIFAGTGTTAFAAGETMTTYMVEFPRASDPNKAGWGHSAMNFLGGWSTGENNGFTIHTQDSFNGKVIYCIEPGVSVHSGDQFTGRGEDFWDDYPSDLNPTIPPDTIKEYIGRIMTYGWQGNASTSWMTDDPEDASKMAGAIATQLLVWETVVGERDSQFNHVDANAQGKNNIAEYISADHPLYSEIFSQYSAIESAVKRHTMLPSFFSSTADAGAYELKWDG